jgi:hypothetical protein
MNYAKSKEVHRCLHRVFGSTFHANGFQRMNSGACSYWKKLDNNLTFAFEVQCSSFGSENGGSMLCLNAGVGPFLKSSDTKGYLYRVLPHIDSVVAKRGSGILRNIRASNSKLTQATWDWQPNMDNWCQYYTIVEVEHWGEFLLPLLPELVHQMILKEQCELANFIPLLAGQRTA